MIKPMLARCILMKRHNFAYVIVKDENKLSVWSNVHGVWHRHNYNEREAIIIQLLTEI